jgi:2-dehydro-3-deoxyphosphogluconate aldolase/(4S)-4-hydroxy-2-oxoglutarate aldolase
VKSNVLQRIVDSGLVVVVRANSADDALRIADSCVQGGAKVIEITFTVPDAARAIEEFSRRNSSKDLIVGAGTVLDPQTARVAMLAGARFVVSPALNVHTAKVCQAYGIPYLPGAGTVREIIEAMQSGAEIVKVFPGEVLGPAFVKAVRAVLPDSALMPTGGVTLENIREWIEAGCVAVGVGGSLTRSASTGDFLGITNLTRRFLEGIRQARL